MSFKMEHPRQLTLSLAVMALALGFLYLKTLSPAFPPDDSPETITAAFSLGIQHPPGYPLAALLGRTAIVALPLGSAAWRMNCLSALLACLAAALMGALAWRLAPRMKADVRLGAAVLAGLGFGLYGVVWDQATAAKGGIYLLNLALGLGAWHAVLSKRAEAFGLLAGLMLANHYVSAVLWLAPLAWALGPARLKALAWASPGLSLYLYLPLRAAQQPLLNWGDPSSWTQFWWMLSRGGYTQAGINDPAIVAWEQASLWWSSLRQGGWWMLPWLAAAGAWRLWKDQRGLAIAFAAAIVLGLTAALFINKTPMDNRWLALIFALPATVLVAPLAGLGLAWIAQALDAPRLGWMLLIAALAGSAMAAQYARSDRSGSYVGWDYAHDLALGQPRDALYLTEGDFHTLPLIHAQVVEGRRRDLQLALNALSGEPWYQRLLARRDPALKLPPAGPADAATRALAALNEPLRPVMVSPYSAWIGGPQLQQRGLARQFTAAPAKTAPPDLAAAWAARPPLRGEGDLEPIEAALLPWYTVCLVQQGNDAMGSGRAADATKAYRRALGRPGMKPETMLAFNLGLAYEWQKKTGPAVAAYERALRADGNFQPAKEKLRLLVKQP
jgi:hypothetical protein